MLLSFRRRGMSEYADWSEEQTAGARANFHSAFFGDRSLLLEIFSLFIEIVSLLVCVGNFAISCCETAVSCFKNLS
jgi:hypothetical protein